MLVSIVYKDLKKQRKYYSGKKKKHTLKSQIVINKDTKEIICTDFAKGITHDFKLFKSSNVKISHSIQTITDTGYQGIKKLHQCSYLPKKRSKKKPLTKSDKSNNKYISSIRIIVENIICKLKVFKILSYQYRNRRKCFSLMFNLITGIYNYELNSNIS